MKKGDKVAIVCCSNGQPLSQKEKIQKLLEKLRNVGLKPVLGNYIFAENSVFSGTAQERAGDLMDFYKNTEIKAIFDISGGDLANEILSYLDFEVIAKNPKPFWGYSDLTTIINAIYAQTGNTSVLYQVRNLISKNGIEQTADFKRTIFEKKQDLFNVQYKFVQQTKMQGIVVGGNIRCLLKLAGTKFWPDMRGKIVLLEALNGMVPQVVTYLNQLKHLGVFEQAAGILLGTFTKMKEEKIQPTVVELVKRYAGPDIPIAYTDQIGHATNSKAIVIGAPMEFRMSNYEIAKLQTEKEFLKYDQEKFLGKFSLPYDEEYIYIDCLKRKYRVNRLTGKVSWSEDLFVQEEDSDFNETMTIFDLLCYSKENCHLAGEFVNIMSLSSIKGSAGPVDSSHFKEEAEFFEKRLDAFTEACEKMGGIEGGKGDVAYQLPLFEFLPVRIQFWESDDEFDASLQIFMDKNILQYMHYETVWYAVGHLLRRLKEEIRHKIQ